MVTENTQPTEDLAQTPPAEVETPITAEPTPAPEQPFTQEQVNRMQAQTRRDERGKFADYGDLKARAAKADELEQAQLSDAQKLEARAIEAERKVGEAQEKNRFGDDSFGGQGARKCARSHRPRCGISAP